MLGSVTPGGAVLSSGPDIVLERLQISFAIRDKFWYHVVQGLSNGNLKNAAAVGCWYGWSDVHHVTAWVVNIHVE